MTTNKSNMQLLDIEVYPNYFLLGIEDYNTKQKYDFELSIYRNDFKLIKYWLNNDYINLNKELKSEEYKTRFKDCVLNKPNYVVTFNGEHYDLVVLSYIKDILSELEDVFSNDKVKITGINIKSDKYNYDSLANKLTNPNWYSSIKINVEELYKANSSKTKQLKLSQEDALKHDMNLMYSLQVQKFKQHPELINEIENKGGVEFLKKCSHIVGVPGSRWEGEGMNSNFIKVLVKAYDTVNNELNKSKNTDISNNEYLSTESNIKLQSDNDKLNILSKIKQFSSNVIEDESFPVWKYKNRFKDNFIHIDLFLYWAKMLRISKKISLKSLAVQLNYPHIQELPYQHNQIVTQYEMNELTKYCINNDLGILRLLLDNRQDDVKLRATILKDFGIECWSWDAVKIANEYLLMEYCKKTGENKYEVNKWRFKKNLDLKIRDTVNVDDIKFKTKYFQDVYTSILDSNAVSFEKTLVLKTGDKDDYVKISLGIGGIHSVPNEGEVMIPEDYCLLTSDVALKRGN